MAHYGDFASRVINYNNRQLFEGFLDFFVNYSSAWNAYQEYHRPVIESDSPFWKLKAFFHYLAGFLLRLILLPFTAMLYTLSRTVLVVLNPFTAWRNNPWKAFYMTLAWVVPACIALADHVYTFIPNLSFGMSQGLLGIEASTIGGLIGSALFGIGMAFCLHAAKIAAQHKNAIEMPDPRQTNAHDPHNVKSRGNKIEIEINHLRAQPETVRITAPKHRPRNLIESPEQPVLQNPYNEYNAASNNVRYAYYQQRKPAICGGPSLRIKKLVNAFDAVNESHKKEQFDEAASKLFDALATAKEASYKYRVSSLDTYEIDSERHTFKRKQT